jgi:hypothetical protein
MADEAAEIAQISFFLAKEGVTSVTIFDANKDVLNQPEARQHDFKVGDTKCRFIYFETVSNRSNPPWLDFVNENRPQDDLITFRARY